MPEANAIFLLDFIRDWKDKAGRGCYGIMAAYSIPFVSHLA